MPLASHGDLLRSLLPKFNGRMAGEISDGALSSFHSAVDAVNCARELQGGQKWPRSTRDGQHALVDQSA